MPHPVFQHTFPNGLTLLAEPMDYVRSATAYAMLPAGAAYDPSDHPGLASVLTGLIPRGAGERDSKQLSAAFDALGVDHGESVDTVNVWFSAGTLSRSLAPALELVADVILRPHFPESDLEAVQALALQDIQGLEDSPQEKVMLELKKRYYPVPLNADKLGTEAGITSITPAVVWDHYKKLFHPNEAVLAVAGNFEWPRLRDQVEKLFAGWKKGPQTPFQIGNPAPQPGHLHKDTQQTQIALAFPAASIQDPGYYAARGAVGVLSGGMSARLFTEVREKRGLCYSVYASHETQRNVGAIVGYAGTRSERAQETLDVMLGEFKRLVEGVETDEIDRVKAGLKSSLIMRQESTSARAGAMAADWSLLGRVRSFDEVQAAIDGLTTRAVQDYLMANPPTRPTVVTLGPGPLSVPTA
ncbi:MAG TPA: pitrilysin family protein [Fimbriiglobus sp.]